MRENESFLWNVFENYEIVSKRVRSVITRPWRFDVRIVSEFEVNNEFNNWGSVVYHEEDFKLIVSACIFRCFSCTISQQPNEVYFVFCKYIQQSWMQFNNNKNCKICNFNKFKIHILRARGGEPQPQSPILPNCSIIGLINFHCK